MLQLAVNAIGLINISIDYQFKISRKTTATTTLRAMYLSKKEIEQKLIENIFPKLRQNSETISNEEFFALATTKKLTEDSLDKLSPTIGTAEKDSKTAAMFVCSTNNINLVFSFINQVKINRSAVDSNGNSFLAYFISCYLNSSANNCSKTPEEILEFIENIVTAMKEKQNNNNNAQTWVFDKDTTLMRSIFAMCAKHDADNPIVQFVLSHTKPEVKTAIITSMTNISNQDFQKLLSTDIVNQNSLYAIVNNKTIFAHILETKDKALIEHAINYVFNFVPAVNTLFYYEDLDLASLVTLINRYTQLTQQSKLKSIKSISNKFPIEYEHLCLFLRTAVKKDSVALLQAAENLAKKLISPNSFDKTFDQIFHELKLYSQVEDDLPLEIILYILFKPHHWHFNSAHKCKELFMKVCFTKNKKNIKKFFQAHKDSILVDSFPPHTDTMQDRLRLDSKTIIVNSNFYLNNFSDYLAVCLCMLLAANVSDVVLDEFFTTIATTTQGFAMPYQAIQQMIATNHVTLLQKALPYFTNIYLVLGMLGNEIKNLLIYEMLIKHLYSVYKNSTTQIDESDLLRLFIYCLYYFPRVTPTEENKQNLSNIANVILDLSFEFKLPININYLNYLNQNSISISETNQQRCTGYEAFLNNSENLMNENLSKQYSNYLYFNNYLANIYQFYFIKNQFNSTNNVHMQILEKSKNLYSDLLPYGMDFRFLLPNNQNSQSGFLCINRIIITKTNLALNKTHNQNPQTSNMPAALFTSVAQFPASMFNTLMSLNVLDNTQISSENLASVRRYDAYICEPYYKLLNQNYRKALKDFYTTHQQTINIQSPIKKTSILHIAAYFGKFDTITDLIELGADPTLCDKDGVYPFEYITRALRADIPLRTENLNEKIKAALMQLLRTVPVPSKNDQDSVYAAWYQFVQTTIVSGSDFNTIFSNIKASKSMLADDQLTNEVKNFFDGIDFIEKSFTAIEQKLSNSINNNNNIVRMQLKSSK